MLTGQYGVSQSVCSVYAANHPFISLPKAWAEKADEEGRLYRTAQDYTMKFCTAYFVSLFE